MNTYYFQGIRWIPSYRDFDYDDYKIVAESTEKAWQILDQMTTLKSWKSVSLTSINDVYYYESV
jgi:hypothetical protein